jgi:hypothetical protein
VFTRLEYLSGFPVPAWPSRILTQAVASLHVGALRLDGAVAKLEATGDARGIALEALHQGASLAAVHRRKTSLPAAPGLVKLRRPA